MCVCMCEHIIMCVHCVYVWTPDYVFVHCVCACVQTCIFLLFSYLFYFFYNAFALWNFLVPVSACYTIQNKTKTMLVCFRDWRDLWKWSSDDCQVHEPMQYQ